MTTKAVEAYREKIGREHTATTTKRKFSMLNCFFKFIVAKHKGFVNPIGALKDFRTHRGGESEEVRKYLAAFIAAQKTANTKRSYENLAKLFFTWVKKDLGEITRADLMAYRDHLRDERRHKDSTVWNKFVALNRFFKYVAQANRKFHNPLVFGDLQLIFPKKDKGYYTTLTGVESERILKQVPKKTAMGKRDLAMLLLMLVYGLRANEVAKLRHRNFEPERVDGQQKVWIVDRKGRFQNRPKTAIILNGRALRAMDEWLAAIKAAGVKVAGALPVFLPFIHDREAGELVIRRDRLATPLSVKAVENMVAKYLGQAKITREEATLSPHALRHTAFTTLAREGMKIHEIQTLAGHKDINTTMIYIHSQASYADHPGMHNPLNR